MYCVVESYSDGATGGFYGAGAGSLHSARATSRLRDALVTVWGWANIAVSTALFGTLAILTSWVPPRGPALPLLGPQLVAEPPLAQPASRPGSRSREEAAALPQAIYMSNHESGIDILLLLLAIRQDVRFLAKRELFFVPFMGWSMWLAGFVPVDRRRTDKARGRPLEPRTAASPRASRSSSSRRERARATGSSAPFKKSGFLTALKTGLPIVPVAVSGARAVLGAQGMVIRRGPVVASVSGRPIPTAAARRSRPRGADGRACGDGDPPAPGLRGGLCEILSPREGARTCPRPRSTNRPSSTRSGQVKYPGFSRDIVSFGFVKDLDGRRRQRLLPARPDDRRARRGRGRSSASARPSSEPSRGLGRDDRRPGRRAPAARHRGRDRAQGHPQGHALHRSPSPPARAASGSRPSSANLALALKKLGYEVGLMDSDIYGPSQQMMMGINDEAVRQRGGEDPPDRALRRPRHVDRLPDGRRHAGHLARADDLQGRRAVPRRRGVGQAGLPRSSTCRPAPATPSSRSRRRSRSRAPSS